MAERRMFAKTIIDSDVFLDMPLSTQALYFHLSMRADDDGFINNPKKIQRMIGCAEDDLKVLIAKNFIIPFESGIVVIKHWKIHNYIRTDRYKETVYQEEKAMLETKDNKAYTFGVPNDSQAVYQMETQVRLGKDRIGKESIDEYIMLESENENSSELDNESVTKKEKPIKKPIRHKHGEYNNVLLSDEDYEKLKSEFPSDYEERIERLSSYMASTGKSYKNHLATIRNWARKDRSKTESNVPQQQKQTEKTWYKQNNDFDL